MGSIDFYGKKKKKNSERQNNLVTVSDRESKSEIYDEFPDRESQLFKIKIIYLSL